MNTINRLEESWTPSWDLGLQSEFGFVTEEDGANEMAELAESSRAKPWAKAGQEVLNGQGSVNRRLASEPSSLADFIRFFETLGASGGNDE